MTDTTMDQASPKTGQVSPKTGQASAKTGQAAANGDQASLNYVPVQHTALKNAEIIPMSLRSVHFVMPGGVDDASAPSGGNAYDRRLCLDLPGFGWQVHKHAVAGSWPRPSASARTELARTLSEFPDDSVVLLDGLVACGVPEIIVPEAERLRLAVLVHLPLGDETGLAPAVAAELDAKERATLRAVSAVVATSDWAVRRLVAHHGLAPERVHVAAPGADIAPLASGTDGVSRLLCVAAVTPRKGQHRLIEALATVTDLPWSCVCVGGLTQDPTYVAQLRGLIEKYGLGDRLHLAGPQAGAELDASYAAADLMVLTSYAETYGMAVTEALARGIPVLATDVGGLPEAVGRAPDGGVPGILVPPENPAALAAELRGWFGEADVRRRLKAAARSRRAALDGWATTARSLAGVLGRLPQQPRRAA
ncbi:MULTISPECIES: glycosyltransferase family 4 protein [Streptomyces]|nr:MULTISPECIES: glycosyltransferase family 4 protein [Streptomyces]GHD37915.1 glycosyl transferase [Streptomyces mirabilis]